MPRINVWVPDELHATIRRRLPGLNVSAVVQGALAAKLECTHEHLACTSCSTPVDHRVLVEEHLGRFYRDAFYELRNLVRVGGTAEGAARVLKTVAQSGAYHLPDADRLPLPRPTRANREEILARKVTPLPIEADSRRRHPTARSKPA